MEEYGEICIASGNWHGVTCVNEIAVQLDLAPRPFATQNKEKISAFWQERRKSHPHFYDGQVHVMTSWKISQDQTGASAFVGKLCRTNFASFLYWKNCDGSSRNEYDISGGAALLCPDGALLMAVSGEHTIAPGTLEFPSGFVDISDFAGDKLDFDYHVEREVIEEFVITRGQLGNPKQHFVSAADGTVQVLSIFFIDTNGNEFAEGWRSRAGALRLEISDVVAIYRSSDLTGFLIPTHVKAAISKLLVFGR